jgi:hypothetical protein
LLTITRTYAPAIYHDQTRFLGVKVCCITPVLEQGEPSSPGRLIGTNLPKYPRGKLEGGFEIEEYHHHMVVTKLKITPTPYAPAMI